MTKMDKPSPNGWKGTRFIPCPLFLQVYGIDSLFCHKRGYRGRLCQLNRALYKAVSTDPAMGMRLSLPFTGPLFRVYPINSALRFWGNGVCVICSRIEGSKHHDLADQYWYTPTISPRKLTSLQNSLRPEPNICSW